MKQWHPSLVTPCLTARFIHIAYKHITLKKNYSNHLTYGTE